MVSKRLLLTLPEPIFKLLEKEKQKYAYKSIQQIITETLREKFIKALTKKTGTKRGRPKKFRPEKFLTAKKLWDKDGIRIPI